MFTNATIHGLYAITDAGLQAPDQLAFRVEAALRGGARVIQYRDKTADDARRQQEAAELAALCRRHGAAFIVNDDVPLAVAVGADGVHLGQDDGSLRQARELGASELIVGVSCYGDLGRARRAVEGGAGYVAFGSVFPSSTKPAAPPVTLETITEAARTLPVPVVAIGGIHAGNAGEVIAAGADAVAVITAVFAAEDVESSARRLADLFEDR